MVLNFFGIDSFFGKVDLQLSAQPAITRVNKQVRAEALSIYYEENTFYVQINLTSTYHSIRPSLAYKDFCKIIRNLTPYRAQSPGIGYPLRHIRSFQAEILTQFEPDGILWSSFHTVKFAKGEAREFMTEESFRTLGGDETDWSDLTSVDALIKQWMQSEFPDSRPEIQEQLVHILQILGANLLSDSSITVTYCGSTGYEIYNQLRWLCQHTGKHNQCYSGHGQP